jgi:hypothetical protein
MECTFKILSNKGLRVNSEEPTFCADEIKYLWYWASKSGIKPIPKKAEAIKNIGRPTKRNGLRQLLP